MKKEYDLLIVGAGIYGATAAYKAKQEGKRCLVIDQRPHLGGNSTIANYKGRQYNLSFNMNTFYQMWGVLTPEEAKANLADQETGVTFGGRLAEYKYYDIAPIIEKVMNFE